MAEAVILSAIEKLADNLDYDEEPHPSMGELFCDMGEIEDIARDNKLGEGRRLNFLLSDFIHMADDAIDLYKHRETNDLHYELDSVKSWLGEIKKRMLKLGDDGAENESNMGSSNNVDDGYVVGFEKEVQMLLRTKIIYHGIQTPTLLIKGIGGTGKTTLAREIYNHPTVIERFESRAWVSNSTHFTLKELLIKLIQQVDPQNLHTSSFLEEMDNRRLLDMLSHHLQGTRYLIVLDDVPKQMHIKSVLKALPQENNGSKLLLTSHITHMNLTIDVDDDVHRMKPLDSNKSWQLFLKTIDNGNKLPSEHKFPMNLEQEGKQMLRKRGGLPLAIKEVGKQLAEKKVSGVGEWEELLKSVDFSSTLELLELFYQKVDPRLESCFLSMAFFKENTTLRAEKLSQIWAAGGVLKIYDYYAYFLFDLANESVIEVGDKSTEYHMNSVLHMLSIKKAEEKLGFEILSSKGNNLPSQSPRHHRVIIGSREKFNYSTDQDKHLVSLFFHGGGDFDVSPSYWKSFEQRLRILDLEDFGLKILPETIGTLMELRYLGLRNNYIKELPQSLGCLKKLEVLDIAQNFMVEVPDIIWEMCSLRCLYLSDVMYQKPLKIDVLHNLYTLTYVSIDNWTYELSSLKELSSLVKLGIEGLDGNSDVSKLFVSLADLKHLEHLILRGCRFRSMPCLDELAILQSLKSLKLDGLLARLPRSFPPKIESLTLIDSCLDEDPMPLLEKLPNLTNLQLRNAYTGEQMVILHDGFPHLQVMCIGEVWNLRNIRVEKGAMCLLEKLEIKNCPNLDTLPEAVVSFLKLKELKMVTTKNIAKKMRYSDLISNIRIVNVNK